ncbi:MAG: hypothetical protein IJC89_03265 [Clostridia bacterium]|nr:hypothetical protein [Clostridia bacterium]
MKKVLFFLLINVLIVSLIGCSNLKADIAAGNKYVSEGEYSLALTYFDKAIKTGDAPDKVIATAEVLRAYISASEAYEKGDTDKAYDILDSLEYDYHGYPFSKEIQNLINNVENGSVNNKYIENKLSNLRTAINDNDLEIAYELVNELEGINLTIEQKEEFDFLTYRLSKLDKNNSTQNKEDSAKTDETPDQEPSENTQNTDSEIIYRVRKSADDAKSQLGAFKSYDNAVKLAKENPGYFVFDQNGNKV